MKILSLVVPVYNEEKTLCDIVDDILAIEKDKRAIEYDIKLEIILVDDFSSDNSLKIAKELAKNNPKIKVFAHPKNKGKGAALKTGFKEVQGDFIGIQDADREYSPLDYLKLLEPILQDKADVVYGSRYLKQDTRRVLYYWHTFMNKGLTFLTNIYSNLDITDMETCYKLFRKDVIKKIAPNLKENRFGFEPEVTIQIAKGKYRLWECAISYNPRSYEEGKKISAKDGLRALYCIMHYGGHIAPMPMQILLYLFIGGVSAVANIIAFLIFAEMFDNLMLNITLAFIISAIMNYLLCIALLFRHKARWSSFGELVAYAFVVIVTLALDYYLTYFFLFLNLGNFWAKSLSSLIGVVGNFLLRKYFVFKERNI